MHEMGHGGWRMPRGRGATLRQTARHGVLRCTMAGGSETGSGAGGSKVYYSYRDKQHSLLNSGALKVHVSYRESHTLYSTRAPPAPRARLTGDGSAWRAPPPGSHAHVSVVLEVLLMQRARQPPSTKAQRASGPCGLALLRAPAYCPLLN